MMGVRFPDIVISSAGHDEGSAFVVVDVQGDRVLLVNGKTRKLTNPKTKSLKHIRPGRAGSPELEEALRQGTATDRLIRKELAKFCSEFED